MRRNETSHYSIKWRNYEKPSFVPPHRLYLSVIVLFVVAATTASAQTWTSLNSPTGFKNVRDFVIDNTGDKLYAADSVNLLKSTDNGQTWSTTSGTISAPIAVTCKHDNTDTVLVSGSTFFQRSVNGGSSWSDILAGVANKPTTLANFPLSTRKMLLGRKYASSTVRGIANSADAGATWTDRLSGSYKPKIHDIAVNLTTVDPIYTSYAVAAGAPDGSPATGRGLFYTENYGDTWVVRETGTGDPNWTAVGFVYDAGIVNDVWAGTADGKLYKGVWKATTMSAQSSFPPGHNFQDTVRAIRIDKNNYSIIYVVTDRSIYKTTNKGASWNSVYASAMTDSRGFSLELNPTNSSKLVLGTKGYIYRSTDAASTWTNITSGVTRTLPLASVAVTGSNEWAGSNDLSIATKYNGSSWSTVRLGHKDSTFLGKHSATWLNGTGTRYVFQSGVQDDRMMVYWSDDGGVSYRIHPDLQNFNVTGKKCEGVVADPSLPSKTYAFGSLVDGTINPRNYFYSANYGLSWTRNIGSSTTAAWLTVAPLGDGQHTDGSSKFVYTGTDGAGLLRSEKSEECPWDIISGVTGRVNAVAANKNKISNAYAGTQNGLYFSTNADTIPYTGVSFSQKWNTTEVKRVLIDPRFTASPHNSSYVFWVASNNTIYRSENNGTTANSVSGTLPAGTVVNDLRPDASDTTLIYIATDRGIYKAQLPATPGLTSPSDGATNLAYCTDLLFQWSSAAGATSYDFQLDTNDATFASPVTATPSTNQYTYTPDLQCGATYYWRVRSSDGTNFGKSPWSAVRSFTTSSCALAAPTLTAPANGATNVLYCIVSTEALTFTWNSVTCATNYRFQLDNNSDFSSTLVSTLTSNATQYSYTSDLTCSTTYYWRVGAIGTSNPDPGTYSSAFSFTTSACSPGPLSAPTLVSPSNNATGVPVNNSSFSWNAVLGAIKYKFYLAGFTTKYVTGTSTSVSGLANNTLYSWNVTAINCYASNPASVTWTFTTETGPSGPMGPQAGLGGDVNELQKPASYALAQNYPNPFNPVTEFRFSIPELQFVSLKIYDVLGREVTALVGEELSPGVYTRTWDASGEASGMYYYRLTAGTFTDIKKLLLMK